MKLYTTRTSYNFVCPNCGTNQTIYDVPELSVLHINVNGFIYAYSKDDKTVYVVCGTCGYRENTEIE